MTKTRSEINNAYAKKAYDDIRLQVPKGSKARWKAAADSEGKSLQGFIRDAVEFALNSKKQEA